MTTEKLPIEITIKTTSHFKAGTKIEVYFDKSLITGKIGDDVKNLFLTDEGNLRLCMYFGSENCFKRLHKRLTNNYILKYLEENLWMFLVDNMIREPKEVRVLYSFTIHPQRLRLKRNWYDYLLNTCYINKKVPKVKTLALFAGLETELYKKGMRYV